MGCYVVSRAGLNCSEKKCRVNPAGWRHGKKFRVSCHPPPNFSKFCRSLNIIDSGDFKICSAPLPPLLQNLYFLSWMHIVLIFQLTKFALITRCTIIFKKAYHSPTNIRWAFCEKIGNGARKFWGGKANTIISMCSRALIACLSGTAVWTIAHSPWQTGLRSTCQHWTWNTWAFSRGALIGSFIDNHSKCSKHNDITTEPSFDYSPQKCSTSGMLGVPEPELTGMNVYEIIWWAWHQKLALLLGIGTQGN